MIAILLNVLVWGGLGIILVYLIVRRMKAGPDDFEDRDN